MDLSFGLGLASPCVLNPPAALLDGRVVAGAWGYQKLLSSWNGACIVARRASDNDDEEFGFGPDNWLNTTALLSWAAGTSAYVTRRYNQLGAGNDAVQATTALQPRIVNAGALDAAPNGRPMERYSGGQCLVAPTNPISGANPRTLSAVCLPSNGAETGYKHIVRIGSLGGNQQFDVSQRYNSSNVWGNRYVGAGLASATSVTEQMHTVQSQYDGATSKILLDGAEIASAAATLNTTGGNVVIGAQSASAEFATALIGDVYILSEVPNMADIVASEKAAWGIA